MLQLEAESLHTVLDSVQGLSMLYYNIDLPRDQRVKHKKDTLPHFQQDEEGPPATFGLLHSAPAVRSQDAVTTTALNNYFLGRSLPLDPCAQNLGSSAHGGLITLHSAATDSAPNNSPASY